LKPYQNSKMKQLLFFASFFILTIFHSTAQSKQEEHLLDGTSFDNYYESGSREHIEFVAGQIISKWIAGPGQDNASGQENYKSKKIGDKIYIVNWLKTPSHSFCTLILNFNQNKLYASAIRGVGTNNEAIFLEEATIDHLHLNEK
jgi:MoaF N-terminal domain